MAKVSTVLSEMKKSNGYTNSVKSSASVEEKKKRSPSLQKTLDSMKKSTAPVRGTRSAEPTDQLDDTQRIREKMDALKQNSERNRLLHMNLGEAEAQVAQNDRDRGAAQRRLDDALFAGETYFGTPDTQEYKDIVAEIDAAKKALADFDAFEADYQRARSLQYEDAGQKALAGLNEITTQALDQYIEARNAVGTSERPSADAVNFKKVQDNLVGMGYTVEEIEQLADYRQRQKNKAEYDLSMADYEEYAKAHPVASSAKSIPMNLAGGVGYLDLALQEFINPDRPADYYAPSMQFSAGADTIRQTVSGEIEANTDWEIADVNVASFLYNTGMSVADSTVTSLLSVAGVPGASALLGGAAATSAARQAKERGGTDEQALMYGLWAGIAEGFFERYSLERLLKTGAVSGNLKQKIFGYMKNFAIQGFTEGSEEVFTTIANTIGDALIMGDLSEFETLRNGYINGGYSEEEAYKLAVKDWISGLAQDFAGGILSGGVMGSATGAINTVGQNARYRKAGKDITSAGNRSAIVDLAMSLDESSPARQAASKMDSEKASNRDIGRLYYDTQRGIYDDAIRARMAELGISDEEAEITAMAINKVLEGEDLSRKEKKAYGASSPAQQIVSELEQEGDPAEWVQRLDRTRSTVAGIRRGAWSGESLADIKGTEPTEALDNEIKTQDIPEEAVDILRQIYKAEGSPADARQLVSDFKLAYYAGRNGVDAETISISDSKIFKAAYSAGVAAADKAEGSSFKTGANVQYTAAALNRAAVQLAIAQTGKSRSKDVAKAKTFLKQQIAIIGSFAKKYNRRVIFENSIDMKGKDGKVRKSAANAYLDEKGDIHMALDATDQLYTAYAIHELVHDIKRRSEMDYDIIKEYVLDALKKNGQDFEALVKKQMDKFGYSREVAEEEVIANTVPAILSDEETIRQMAQSNRGLLERIGEWIRDFISHLEKAFNRLSKSESFEQMEALKGDIESLRKIRDALFEALEDTKEIKTKPLASVKWSRETDNLTEADVSANREVVASMDPIVSISDQYLLPSGDKFIDRVIAAIGNEPETNRYIGKISVTESGIRYDFSHGYGKEKINAIPALRHVMRDGVPVNISRNWDGRGYDTVLLAAPIKIGTMPYLLGVRVKTTQDYTNFELHEVFVVNETAREPFTNETIRNSEATRGSTGGFTKSILQDIVNHKNKMVEDRLDPKFISKDIIDNGGVVSTGDGVPVAFSDGNGGIKLSQKTYEESGRDVLAAYLYDQVENGEFRREDADDMLAQLDFFNDKLKEIGKRYDDYSKWAWSEVKVDDDGNPILSVVKENGDYVMNLDFSLVCKKRRALDAVFSDMIKRGIINDYNLGQEQIVQINDIIRDHGLETACAICFVESKRFRQAKVADDFVKIYNDIVKGMAKNGQKIDYFNFGGNETLSQVSDGIDKLPDADIDLSKARKIVDDGDRTGKTRTVRYAVAKHLLENPRDRKLLDRGDFMNSEGFFEGKKLKPEILKLYNRKKGSGGPKASFGDVQYLSDVIKNGSFRADKAYSVGGVRIQSFSDYIPALVFDYMQMVGDLAAKKLPAHSYTKEELFVRQFGLTGVKINMSLVPKVAKGYPAGLGPNGYAWAGESFDFDTAIEIQSDPEYGKNCGTICVGVSDEHIDKLLDDDRIRMVIPYHKSSLNPIVAKMNKIDQFKDYTLVQSTRYSKGKKLGKADAAKEPNFNELLREYNDPKAAANAYLDWCNEHGYLPKFDRWAGHENYYKLLTDFSLYDDDGNYHAQEAVHFTFPTESSAFGGMMSLIERGLEEHQGNVDKISAERSKIVDEIQERLEKKGQRFSMKDDPELVNDVLSAYPEMDKVLSSLETQEATAAGRKMTDAQINRYVRRWLNANEVKANYDAEALTADMSALFRDFYKSKKMTAEEFAARGAEIMRTALEKARGFNSEAYEADSDIRSFLRSNKIRLTDAQKQEIESAFESIGAFKKAGRGKFLFSDDGTALDVLWQSLSDKRSDLFPADVAEGDMPMELMAAAHAISKENYYFDAFGRNLDEASLESFLTVVSDLTENPTIRRNVREMRAYGEKQYKAAEKEASKQRIAERKKLSEEYNTLVRMVEGRAKHEERKKSDAKLAQKQAIIDRYRNLSDKRKQQLAVQRELFKQRTANLKQTEKKSKLRSRIKKNLNEITTWLMSPTDKKHVPEALRTITASFIESIDLYGDRKASERWQSRMLKLHDYMARADAAKMEDESGVYFNVDEAFLAELKEFIGENEDSASVWDMDEEQLKSLDYLIEILKNAIQTVNSVLIDGKWQAIGELADSTLGRAEAKGPKFQNRLQISRLGKLLSSGNLKPWYFFKNLGDKSLKKLYNGLRDAQKNIMFDSAKAKSFFRETAKKYHANEWLTDDNKNQLEFTTTRGQKVKLTRDLALSIYATAKREAANAGTTGAAHLSVGGFVLNAPQEVKDGKKTRMIEDRRRYPLSDVDLQKILNWLTPDQKAFADELVRYMSEDLSALGNQTSVKLSGYKKFLEKYYFPYKVSSDYRVTDPGKSNDDNNRWKHWGSAKATIKGANAPIVLEDFTKVFGDHVNEMLTYAHLAIPQENFVRVYNYKGSAKEDGAMNSVKAAISTAYGVAAKEYIDHLLTDLGGGFALDPRESNQLFSRFKKAAVLGSLSVAIQQPSAIVRAAAMVDLKYFIGKPKKGAFEEAMKYAGTAMAKRVGGFDTGTSHGLSAWITEMDPTGFKEKGKAIFSKDSSYRDNILGWLPEKMDELTWGAIWEAVKREVKADTGLTGKELLEAAGKRFDDVIDATQVYDSTLSRSDIMRSKSGVVKMSTSFLAEPTVNYNMLVDSIMHAKDRNYEGKSPVGRTLGAVIGSTVLTSLLKGIVYAMRDDDDDQTLLEKYAEAVAGSLIGEPIGKYGYITGDLSPLTMIPYVRDVLSIFQGYDVERADMSLVQDLVEAIEVFGDENKSWETRITTLAGAVSNLCGVPFKNVYRDVKAVFKTFNQHILNGSADETDMDGLIRSIESGLGIEHSTAYYARMLSGAKRGSKQAQKALDGIEYEYKLKVETKLAEGKKKADAESEAKTAIKQSCTNIFKPLYQAAKTADEKAAILQIVRSIKVGGKSLYGSDYDFAKKWKAE